MVVRNDLNRFHLVAGVVNRVAKPVPLSAYLRQEIRDEIEGAQCVGPSRGEYTLETP
jgi:hypothetical protein